MTTTTDCEIITTRILHHPRDLVYRAWTEPEHLKNWWGPKGFTNSFFEYDLVVGGRWRFMMHGPEKGNYPNEVEFTDIERPSFLAWNRITQPLFRVETRFDELSSNETRVIFKMIFETARECDKIKKFAVEKNEENFDKLEAELQVMCKIQDKGNLEKKPLNR